MFCVNYIIEKKRSELNFQSVASYSTLDSLSASALIFPWICTAKTHNLLIQKSHKLQVKLLQDWDFLYPILLIYPGSIFS